MPNFDRKCTGRADLLPNRLLTNITQKSMNASDYLENWLRDQGFRCERDDEGNLRFRYQGKYMFCNKDDDDPNFLRIILLGVYEVEDNRMKVLEAVNTVTCNLKAIKAFIAGDYVYLSIEMFLDSTPDLNDYIERCLDILIMGYTKFAQEIIR